MYIHLHMGSINQKVVIKLKPLIVFQPLLHRPMLKEVTVDVVMDRLPNFPRSKVNDARETIQALLRAMTYVTRMKHAEVSQNILVNKLMLLY